MGELRPDFYIEQIAFGDGYVDLAYALPVSSPNPLVIVGAAQHVDPDLCPRELAELQEAALAYVAAVSATREAKDNGCVPVGDLEGNVTVEGVRVEQVTFGAFVDVVFSHPHMPHPRVIQTEMLHVDPDLCREQLEELMDAATAFSDAVAVARRNPPANLPG